MKLVIGKTAGFCFGVKNAVGKVEEEINKREKIYCLGELVHNKQVTEKLTQKGISFIDNVEEAENNVVFRTHGVTKQTYELAEKLNLEIMDLTCPKVLYIHKLAQEYANKDYFIILTGEIKHPETIGTISFCGKDYIVIEDEKEINSAIKAFGKSNKEKLAVISQTTFKLEKFKDIVEKIKEKVETKKLEVNNTICNATRERQQETEEIAQMVDLMIIIGGKHSSNSKKLYELSTKYCSRVLFIETEKDFDSTQINKNNTIGIMAGASTPEESISRVVEKLKKI